MLQSVDEVLDSDVPVMFCSFAAPKDPQWDSVPERRNKSTCTLVQFFE